jgi:hypothetical protein
MEGVEAGRAAYLTPYALSGVGRESVRNGAGYASEREYPRELGFDLRYAISSNLTLDITANTDFAQVEADDQQVNLDRFSLFFPEKRRFFQEQSGLFDFSTGAGNRSQLASSSRSGRLAREGTDALEAEEAPVETSRRTARTVVIPRSTCSGRSALPHSPSRMRSIKVAAVLWCRPLLMQAGGAWNGRPARL